MNRIITCLLILISFSCKDTHKQLQHIDHTTIDGSITDNTEQFEKEYTNYEKELLNKGFLDVSTIKGVRVDLPYTTENNFVGEVLYDSIHTAFLRPYAYNKLKKAVEILKAENENYSILVYDALRPNAVQHKMWSIVEGTSMERYVASPWAGSIHNYGLAIDCTIFDTEKGQILDMGTDFDELSRGAQFRFNDQLVREGTITKEARDNRILFRRIMTEAGFQPINSEWWHFNALSKEQTRKRFQLE